MTSHLRVTIDNMRRDVVSPRYGVAFRGAQSRHAAFAGHSSVEAILSVMADDREETYPRRELLTQAMVREASIATVWRSVLAVAYYPMLARLRRRLIAPTLPLSELDQLVLTSFLAALDELGRRERLDRTALQLRQRTQRHVFDSLRKERKEATMVETLKEVEPRKEKASEVQGDGHDRERLILRAVRAGRVSADCGELLVATLVKHEALRDYAGRQFAGDDVARERTYQKLKRARTRAIARLRAFAAEREGFRAASS